MVLPLVEEDKPKCFLCHKRCDSIEELRKHQEEDHREFVEHHREIKDSRSPAPGDVTVF